VKRAAVFVAALALLVPAGATAGVIVIGKSIRGVALGMTQKKVKAVLGTPTKTVHKSNDFGPYTELTYPGLKVTFQGNSNVTAVRTTSRADKTAGGLGVGSTVADVKAKVSGLQCDPAGKPRICQKGKSLPGKLVTAFFFNPAGRLDEILIGYVID
jgi:hypothetical protein